MRLSNTSLASMDKIIYDNQTYEDNIDNEEEVHFRFVELYQKRSNLRYLLRKRWENSERKIKNTIYYDYLFHDYQVIVYYI